MIVPALTLKNLGHAFLGRMVVEHVDLQIAPGEIVSLVGPSGCGKSTLVQVAAGLIEPREGKVQRGYASPAMVFQEPRLLPWKTAYDNIAFPLLLQGLKRAERQRRVLQAAAMAQFEVADLEKYPAELSGGMRQRVAIARALAPQPDFIFFDEPFTALDVALKRRMQDLVIQAARESRFAALFITHDLMEAVRISHRILVMHHRGRGVVAQRQVAGTLGERSDAEVFAAVQHMLYQDPAFAHIHDVDERVSA